MKTLTKSSLRESSRKYNRKKFRADVKRQYKRIRRTVIRASKKGKYYMEYRAGNVWNDDDLYVASRLFTRKNPDFRYKWYYDGDGSDGAARWDNHQSYKLRISW